MSELDAGGGIVLPSFVEPHIHLDKVSTRHLPGAQAATWAEAGVAQRRVKREFTAEDVESRASRAIELAVSNGIGIIRAHVAVDTEQELISLEGVLRAQTAVGGRRGHRDSRADRGQRRRITRSSRPARARRSGAALT